MKFCYPNLCQSLSKHVANVQDDGSQKDKKIRDLNIRCFDLADEMDFLDVSATMALESEWEMKTYMRSGFQVCSFAGHKLRPAKIPLCMFQHRLSWCMLMDQACSNAKFV